MNTPRRRLPLLSAAIAVAVWGSVFSLYGAYQQRAENARLLVRAENVAEAVAVSLDAAAEETSMLAQAVAGVARGTLVHTAAVISGEGDVLAASPGLVIDAEPQQSGACRPCHGIAGKPPSQPIESGGSLHLFRPGAVGGDHLYLSLAPNGLVPVVSDLWWAGLAGLVAAGLLVVVFTAREQGWGLGVSSGFVGPTGASLETEWADKALPMERKLRARAAHWEDLGGASAQHLKELKQGAQVTREIGLHIFESARHLSGTVERFREHLNDISGSTSDNSTSLIEMSASVDEVAASSDKLSRYVVTTAASVEQMVEAIGEVADRVETLSRETDATSSSMAHIDTTTREIEVNARQATDLSGRMAEAAREGARAVDETLQGIHSSYQVIQDTARAMDDLQESSLAIGGVVKIINEINDKTKLLALNAAIIAAQAGEHGKSFAVVAHEIKNLSDRTASSTGEISRLIKGIRGRMAAAAEAVARGEGATGSSVALAERAGESLRHIQDTATVAHNMTREILKGTEAQSRGSQNVMASMQEVNAMVTYIRQAASEHRASGEAVTAQTGTMRELTEQVKLATAEQAEVSRYISDAIAAIDRNLQTMVGAMDEKREDTAGILTSAAKLGERGEAEALEVQALEDSLNKVVGEMQALVADLGGASREGGGGGA